VASISFDAQPLLNQTFAGVVRELTEPRPIWPSAFGMSRLVKLQLIGPLLLALVIVAEELATYWLAYAPSSAVAWYLNLELFGIFQHSHARLASVCNVPCLQLMFVATPILLLAIGGAALRQRLPLAVAGNLSLVYACFLGFAWLEVRTPALQAVSLSASVYTSALGYSAAKITLGPHAYMLATLVCASLLSAAAAHLQYLRAVRAR